MKTYLKFPNHLGGRAVSNEQRRDITNGYRSTITTGTVVAVNRILQTIEYEAAMGGNPGFPAMMIKRKASISGGDYDMPNPGDICVIAFLNGNISTPIILGFLESQDPWNAVVFDDNNNLPTSSINDVNEALKYRYYKRHETGSFLLLDKLGNFVAKLFKKATQISDPSKGNWEVNIDNLGNLAITQYKSNGTTPNSTITIDKDGNVTINTIGKIQVTGSEVDLNCDGSDPFTGVVTGHTLCPFTGIGHVDVSTKVKAAKS